VHACLKQHLFIFVICQSTALRKNVDFPVFNVIVFETCQYLKVNDRNCVLNQQMFFFKSFQIPHTWRSFVFAFRRRNFSDSAIFFMEGSARNTLPSYPSPRKLSVSLYPCNRQIRCSSIVATLLLNEISDILKSFPKFIISEHSILLQHMR